ncbi:hypothetical protein GV827_07370 [Sulfitobacter sp. JBTF-M27]|uniref:Acyloxyacyl hydrolase n=1 Tax=Sulfitobacter sediminilitoris TaxID=2698830 RepID=A0A6P0C7R2_9RHOB|nr:hypothetical protein [Sulfitobacter sediminilitoris]NEK22219.1 hypothetical protein [Sulfitobacter sediminilitoris]
MVQPFCFGRYMRAFWIMQISAIAILLNVSAASAESRHRFYFDTFAGVLTENRFYEVFDPSELKLASSGLLGVGIGWERQISDSRFHLGLQFQAVAHAGRQDHLEFNLPVVLRYVPPRPVPRWLKSASFGLGLSHATKVPQVELDRTGESQRTFAYWLAEVEVSLPRSDNSMFFRLHHRSDAYGGFEANGGSTALAFGWRVPF